MLALALGAESLLVNQGLKRLFKRPRPTAEGDPRYPVRRPLTSSFPSGHASAAAFTAVLLTSWDGKRSAPLWWTLASTVAVSRAYVRIHHASDVVAGMAVGTVLGLGARTHPAPFGNHGRRREVDVAMTRQFGLTFDYRCPWARIVHEHVVTALRAGADWDVTWLPFSLGQAHVEEGQPSVWEQPEQDTGIVALQAAMAIRDTQPDKFIDAHYAMYEHRHARRRPDQGPRRPHAGARGRRCRRRRGVGRGRQRSPLATVEKEHTAFVESHTVWGVPTFIVGDQAVFVRLLERPDGDPAKATATIERLLDQIDWPTLNEFKHTSIPR